MTKSLWFKRTSLLMCLLVLFLCLVPGFQQPAKAVALVDDVALFLIGALAVSGVTLVISEGGLDGAIDWVVDKFEDFLDSASLQLNTVLSLWDWVKLRTGLSTDSDSAQLVTDFCDYLIADESLTDDTDVSVYGTLYIYSSGTTWLSWGGNRSPCVKTDDGYAAPFLLVDSPDHSSWGGPWYRPCLVSLSPSSSAFSYGNGTSASSFSRTYNGVVYYFNWFGFASGYGGGNPVVISNPLNIPVGYSSAVTVRSNGSSVTDWAQFDSDFLSLGIDLSSFDSLNISTGSISVPAIPADQSLGLSIPGVTPTDTVDDALSVLSDLVADNDIDTVTGSVIDPLNPPGPSEVSLDPAQFPLPVVVQGSVTTVLGGGSISINNGAEDAIPVYLPGGITLTWPTDGLPIDWPSDGIPIDWGDAPSITMELPDTFFDDLSDAIAGALDDSLADTRPVREYQTPGLPDVFPFCIPFDIYRFFSCLAAEPNPPRFEIPFVVDGLVDYTFVLDLAPFNNVAQVLRTMELLLFCVGLALITRNLIRG